MLRGVLMGTQEDRLRAEWGALLGSFGVAGEDAGPGFAELAAAYGGPGRFYHNLDHVRAVLHTIDGLADLAPDPAAVRLAAWFHDAVYDPRAGDNEERSAALAEARCVAWGIPRATVGAVVRLVLATKTHGAAADDADAHVLLDADLAVLGAADEDYDRYARAIRREYAWVPEDAYRRGRARILENFLRRQRIFRLDRMHRLYEAAARRNLGRELGALGA